MSFATGFAPRDDLNHLYQRRNAASNYRARLININHASAPVGSYGACRIHLAPSFRKAFPTD
jgi:hypothetical protein